MSGPKKKEEETKEENRAVEGRGRERLSEDEKDKTGWKTKWPRTVKESGNAIVQHKRINTMTQSTALHGSTSLLYALAAVCWSEPQEEEDAALDDGVTTSTELLTLSPATGAAEETIEDGGAGNDDG